MDKPIIDGVSIELLNTFSDEKGKVLHFIKSNAMSFDVFGECYFSEINPNCVKAWKKHTKQIQNITVPVGNIKVVLYDDRPKSFSKNKLQIFEIGRPNLYYRICIPPNVWHGFKCISRNPALLANCANMIHDANENIVLPFNDNYIPLNWDEL